MLKVKDIQKRFGGIRALNGVSLEVDKATTVGLIGPNGSGKSTLFNIISGFYPADSGTIEFMVLRRPLTPSLPHRPLISLSQSTSQGLPSNG